MSASVGSSIFSDETLQLTITTILPPPLRPAHQTMTFCRYRNPLGVNNFSKRLLVEGLEQVHCFLSSTQLPLHQPSNCCQNLTAKSKKLLHCSIGRCLCTSQLLVLRCFKQPIVYYLCSQLERAWEWTEECMGMDGRVHDKTVELVRISVWKLPEVKRLRSASFCQ